MSSEYGDRQHGNRAEYRDRDGYAMTCGEIAKLVGITAGGVWMVERAVVRKLWRMKLPSRQRPETAMTPDERERWNWQHRTYDCLVPPESHRPGDAIRYDL